MPEATVPTVRRMDFSYGISIPRHWMHESAVATHVGNSLHLLFPEGERFFIRSVQHYRDRITNPQLLERVDAFIGQERQHSREHGRFAMVLRAQGYLVDPFASRYRKFTRATDHMWPPALRLAATVACEHFTAIMGAHALSTPHLDSAPPALRDLFRWHAAEEIEHKSVAFDVLKTVQPNYIVRMMGLAMATVGLASWWLIGARTLLRQEGIGWIEMWREHRRVQTHVRKEKEGIATRVFVSGIRQYMRRDFHPDDIDDRHLAEHWLAKNPPPSSGDD